MVDKRHSGPSRQAGSAAVPLYGLQPPVGTPYGLEVSAVEDFFARHDDWPWNPPRPGRATFHYLILVTEGELRHDVDHVTRTVASGQWLWVRPGHAQCWHPPGAARGPFILFEPDVLRPDLARLLAPLTAHDAPAVLSPHPDDAAWLQQTALQLLDEHRALGRRPLDVHHALRRSLLESLLLRLANSPGIAPVGTQRPRPRPALAVAVPTGTGASWTPWSCTFASCIKPRITPSCSTARSAPSAVPPRTPPARGA